MTHKDLVKEVCSSILDANGYEIDADQLAEAVYASISEKRRLGVYGVRQNKVEELFERERLEG